MASCSIGAVLELKLFNFQPEFSKTQYDAPCKVKCTRSESFSGLSRIQKVNGPIHSAWFNKRPQRLTNSLAVSCLSDEKNDTDNTEKANSEEKPSTKDQIVPSSLKVQSLLTTICDTTSIAEFELKLAGFRVYVKRDLVEKSIPAPISSPPVAPANISNQNPASNGNGSGSATSLAISKPKHVSIQRILETASDEGLVIIQSPKVGFFRTSRTIKGKRAPPSCKELQQVKEGQVVCYVEQLGAEIPIESDVSGEVIKILRRDGEPVGYGDALIAILPSFPGIKKLQ